MSKGAVKASVGSMLFSFFSTPFILKIILFIILYKFVKKKNINIKNLKELVKNFYNKMYSYKNKSFNIANI